MNSNFVLWLALAAMMLMVVLLANAKATEPSAPQIVTADEIVLIDGDTISVAGERMRIKNIDTPETYRPTCDHEMILGYEAKARLRALLQAGPVTIVRYGHDYYQRTLVTLSVWGMDIGEILIAEKLALKWTSRLTKARRVLHWCPPGPNRRL